MPIVSIGPNVTSQPLNDNFADYVAHKAETVTGMVNVKTGYGAIGDGVADDTTALQNAIDYCIANKAELYLPSGNYLITSTLTVTDTIRIVGQKGANNKVNSVITLDSASDITAIEVSNGDDITYIYNIYMENILITSKTVVTASYNTTQTGIRLNKISECWFSNVTVVGFKIGIECRAVSITDFMKLYVGYCQYGIWLGDKDLSDTSSPLSGMNNFYFCNFWKGQHQVVLGGELNHFVGCHLESSSETAFYVDNAYLAQVSHITIKDCNIRMYTSDTRMLKINPSVGADTLLVYQFQIENTFCKLLTATSAIEQVVNGAGVRGTRISIKDSSFFGITTAAVNSSYAMSVEYNGLIRVRSGADGSGSNVSPFAGSVVSLGKARDYYRNILYGTTKLSGNTSGITNEEGDMWYDSSRKTLRLHEGTTALYVPTMLSSFGTYDPGSLASGSGETSPSFTVTGAELRDFILVSAPYDLQGVTAFGYVDATNSVKIRLENNTGATVDLSSGTWYIRVIKQ